MTETEQVPPWPAARGPKPLNTFDYSFAHKQMKFDPDQMRSAIFFNLAGHPRRPTPERLQEWLKNPSDAEPAVVKCLFEDLPGTLLNSILWNSGASIYEVARLFHKCKVDYWKTVVWIDQFSMDSSKPKGTPSYYD